MKFCLSFGVILCLGWMPLIAQEFQISGRLIDVADSTPLIGANIILKNEQDTTRYRGTSSDELGEFKFEQLSYGTYGIHVQFMGYKSLRMKVVTDRQVKRLGMIVMEVDTLGVGIVKVDGQMIHVEQKGDTTQYNAEAYKTNPDATAADLVVKMPGVSIENGKVNAQGEEVKRVTVDGKPFFEQDPQMALKVFPAEVISQIQVFDKLSDQSQFTGYDDGQGVKAMNIVTRPGRNIGQFGKIYGGYGQNDFYQLGGSINLFQGKQRISLIGMSNNINQQNFAIDDLLGVLGGSSSIGRGFPGSRGGRGSRPGGGHSSVGEPSDFMVGQQAGISKTHAIGLNYTNSFKDKLEIAGSYFFNISNTDNTSYLWREYFTGETDAQYYEENGDTHYENYNHRFNMKLEWKIDSSQSFILSPQLNLQDNTSKNLYFGTNFSQFNETISSSDNRYKSDGLAYNLSGSLLYRRKFNKRGRTISLNIKNQLNRQDNDNYLNSANLYFIDNQSNVLLDQLGNSLKNERQYDADLVYTEPLGKTGQLRINYRPSLQNGDIEKFTFYYDSVYHNYQIIDTILSNTYESNLAAHYGGINMRQNIGNLNMSVELGFQQTQLKGEETFPEVLKIRKDFQDWLPGAMLQYKGAGNFQARMFYRTSTYSPSVSQLQKVIDNSNPLLLTSGNPNLKQEFRHSLMTRLSFNTSDRTQYLYLFIYAGMTKNYIANSSWMASRDTVLNDGTILFAGSQLSEPLNLSGYRMLRTFISYGRPLNFLKTTLNLTQGLSLQRSPGYTNSIENNTDTYTYTIGTGLNSNFSERIDFSLNYNGNFSWARNDRFSSKNTHYYSHSLGIKTNIIVGNGWVFRTDLAQSYYSGLSDVYNKAYYLFNLGFGKKFFKKQNLELSLMVFDLFGQNSSISRITGSNYYEDTENKVMERYVMVMLTWQLRNFYR